jgi:ATP-dependent DNA helicase RecG
MMSSRSLALVNDLLALPAEQAWVEFKGNNTEPQMIGQRISALSNAARLADKNHAYMLWGVRDEDHTVIGTRFQPSAERTQGQPLEFWLAQRLSPDIAFSFHEIAHAHGRIVLLEIPAATTAPVEFDRTTYIRVDSATPRLSDHPDRMRALWARLQLLCAEARQGHNRLTGNCSPPNSSQNAAASSAFAKQNTTNRRSSRRREYVSCAADKFAATLRTNSLLFRPKTLSAGRATWCGQFR